MKLHLNNLLKGFLMGTANVIPGVSGGTIAFITGIYDDLIGALKSIDIKALKLLSGLKFKELADHINLSFLVTIFSGAIVGIVSLGYLLKWVIDLEVTAVDGTIIRHYYEPWVWSFFFGLILISVYYVGKKIHRWNAIVILAGLAGTVIAIFLSVLQPGSENDNFIYLLICGIAAMGSMLLPGLSGSFVLILMGNYYLIMIESVQKIDLAVLFPVGIGAVIGFVLLSRMISYLLNKYQEITISTLTGFILGSLFTIWPWKTVMRDVIEKADGTTKEVIVGYKDWALPQFDAFDMVAIGLIILGGFLVWLVEFLGDKIVTNHK